MNDAATPTTDDRYKEWFGSVDTNRHNIVKKNFSAVFSTLDTQEITFNCACEEGEDNTFAYVYPNIPYEIHLCNAFWEADLEGTDSQSGTLVHETSHFTVVAGTSDHIYGQSGARQLAIDNPYLSTYNADSLEFFAENNPELSMTDYMTETEPETEYIIDYASLLDGFNSEETSIDNGGKDYDVFELTVPTSGTLLIYTTGNLSDTVGRLYNKNSLIAYNDDEDYDNGIYTFKINTNINAGKHYITVDSYGDSTGDYTLHVEFIPSFNNAPIINYLLN